MDATEIRPQTGPQHAFLANAGDIAIYGGAAGGGKTWALLLEPLRHMHRKDFGAVVFRRTYPQITAQGGMWDESRKVYPLVGAIATEGDLTWTFPSGAKLKFAHLQHESNVDDWQGSQIPLILLDELTHFTERQFFTLLSRNRSVSGIRPYMRATCNPDVDSWVARFIAWWIDQDTGFAIPERAGAIRWFVRIDEELLWADTAEALFEQYPDIPPKSVSFIPARLQDNAILMKADPGYLANLMAQPRVERERLLGGNWKIRANPGEVFQRQWFPIVDAAPAAGRLVRFWDMAATAAAPGKDPDWTCGALVTLDAGRYYIRDIRRMRGTPQATEALVKQTAELDGRAIPIWMEQEPGSSGVTVIDHYRREVLVGWSYRGIRSSGKKETRAGPVSAAAEVQNVLLVRGAWNGTFLDEAESFPGGAHDDQIDAVSGGVAMLTSKRELTFL